MLSGGASGFLSLYCLRLVGFSEDGEELEGSLKMNVNITCFLFSLWGAQAILSSLCWAWLGKVA